MQTLPALLFIIAFAIPPIAVALGVLTLVITRPSMRSAAAAPPREVAVH